MELAEFIYEKLNKKSCSLDFMSIKLDFELKIVTRSCKNDSTKIINTNQLLNDLEKMTNIFIWVLVITNVKN